MFVFVSLFFLFFSNSLPPLQRSQKEEVELKKQQFVLEGMPSGAKEPYKGPIWFDRAFTGLFGDAYIRDTELEGGQIAPSLDTACFILQHMRQNHLNWLLQDSTTTSSYTSSSTSSSSSPPFESSSWLSMRLEHVEKILKRGAGVAHEVFEVMRSGDGIDHNNGGGNDYDKALRAAAEVRRSRDQSEPGIKEKKISDFLSSHLKGLHALQPGERMLLPGGWIAMSGGHAIMHIVQRHADPSNGTYSFISCNTGGGVFHHPGHVTDWPKLKFKTSIRLDNIPASRMLDPGFWYVYWRPQFYLSEDNGEHILYDVLLPWLSGGLPLVAALQRCPPDPLAEYRTPQRAGTCYFKSILEAIRYLFRLVAFLPRLG